MGVKSTVYLTREEAETMYRVLHSLLSNTISILSDRQLEDILEKMNDEYHRGEGFENYQIIGNEE